ncbi:hypothetical protein PGB90_005537 [Kerria lacca]
MYLLLEKVTSADEIANKITVLDSIMRVSAAVNQVSNCCVWNCFRKAGFKGPNDEDMNNEAAGDSFDDLTNKLPSDMKVGDSDYLR